MTKQWWTNGNDNDKTRHITIITFFRVPWFPGGLSLRARRSRCWRLGRTRTRSRNWTFMNRIDRTLKEEKMHPHHMKSWCYRMVTWSHKSMGVNDLVNLINISVKVIKWYTHGIFRTSPLAFTFNDCFPHGRMFTSLSAYETHCSLRHFLFIWF